MLQCKVPLMHLLFHLKYIYNGIFIIKKEVFISVLNLAYAILCVKFGTQYNIYIPNLAYHLALHLIMVFIDIIICHSIRDALIITYHL